MPKIVEKYPGKCIKCHEPALPNKRMCASCKARAKEYCKITRDRRIAKGLCGACGKNVPESGRVTCSSCMEESSRKRQERVSKRRNGAPQQRGRVSKYTATNKESQ